MDAKLPELIKKGLSPKFFNEEYEIKVLTELKDFGKSTLRQLDDIVPDDFINKAMKYYVLTGGRENYSGVIRDIMMITDVDKYFKNCWNQNWNIINKRAVEFVRSYGVDLDTHLYRNKIKIRQS